MEEGDKLVVFDHCRVGQPDEYVVVQDENGNSWHIQPEWLAGPNGPDSWTRRVWARQEEDDNQRRMEPEFHDLDNEPDS